MDSILLLISTLVLEPGLVVRLFDDVGVNPGIELFTFFSRALNPVIVQLSVNDCALQLIADIRAGKLNEQWVYRKPIRGSSVFM